MVELVWGGINTKGDVCSERHIRNERLNPEVPLCRINVVHVVLPGGTVGEEGKLFIHIRSIYRLKATVSSFEALTTRTLPILLALTIAVAVVHGAAHF